MTNEMSRERCLEVLGLAPGAPGQDIKAAYRDMAKVWHPDRFTHEPRLQQKAQEKLKEINDAYQQLLTGHYSATRNTDEQRGRRRQQQQHTAPPQPGHTDGPSRPATGAQSAPLAQTETHARRGFDWRWLVPVLAFCATFAFLTPRLLSSSRPPADAPAEPAAESARETSAETERQTTADGAAAKDTQKPKPQEAQPRPATARPDDEARSAAAVAAATPLRALPTVTVSIDPTTGLRARAACPNKTAMTFPAGGEPSAYCTASHRAEVSDAATPRDAARPDQPKKSRLKSFADRVASPTKWLPGNDGAARADKKSTPTETDGRN